MAKAKAGPVVTDNGGMIIDWYAIYSYYELKMNSLKMHTLQGTGTSSLRKVGTMLNLHCMGCLAWLRLASS